ncbi:hypothetical protein AVEN_112884-1 [Araneus ventricosus]|uniref:Uncharacterized protein n=1 Tax=Araneus ventricosus TaxID=182803 RepID=A0A4Y2D8V2_ARAVE|nr:hypothetical protein AVEN_15688-1 [Araneus ventricosus]GBM12470.1 hypothetical protein AVEN_112884-1 [Araneus ventricosus]
MKPTLFSALTFENSFGFRKADDVITELESKLRRTRGKSYSRTDQASFWKKDAPPTREFGALTDVEEAEEIPGPYSRQGALRSARVAGNEGSPVAKPTGALSRQPQTFPLLMMKFSLMAGFSFRLFSVPKKLPDRFLKPETKRVFIN